METIKSETVEGVINELETLASAIIEAERHLIKMIDRCRDVLGYEHDPNGIVEAAEIKLVAAESRFVLYREKVDLICDAFNFYQLNTVHKRRNQGK